MKATTVSYRLESFLYPANVTRIELESGDAEWIYIRLRAHELADSRNEQVMLYVYNNNYHCWDYVGKALPGGDWYSWLGQGPFRLSADGTSYSLRKGGEA